MNVWNYFRIVFGFQSNQKNYSLTPLKESQPDNEKCYDHYGYPTAHFFDGTCL